MSGHLCPPSSGYPQHSYHVHKGLCFIHCNALHLITIICTCIILLLFYFCYTKSVTTPPSRDFVVYNPSWRCCNIYTHIYYIYNIYIYIYIHNGLIFYSQCCCNTAPMWTPGVTWTIVLLNDGCWYRNVGWLRVYIRLHGFMHMAYIPLEACVEYSCMHTLYDSCVHVNSDDNIEATQDNSWKLCIDILGLSVKF